MAEERALLGCLPRTLSTSDQKLGDPVTSDLHVVSDLGERTPEEWVRYSFADLSHGHENQCKNTENIQFSLAVTCSGQVRPLWSLGSHWCQEHLSPHLTPSCSNARGFTLRLPVQFCENRWVWLLMEVGQSLLTGGQRFSQRK